MTPWTSARQASLSLTISRSWLQLMSIESVTLSNHLILCCPLLLPSIFPSIRVFSNESVLCIRWPKYWRFSFSISPSMNIWHWFPGGSTVKCLSAMQETWVRSLGWEDPLEKEMAAHSSTLTWKIPWMEEPGGLQSMGLVHEVAKSWTSLSLFFYLFFRIDWFDLFAVEGIFKSLSSTTIQKHQFFGAQTSLWSNSHICT